MVGQRAAGVRWHSTCLDWRLFQAAVGLPLLQRDIEVCSAYLPRCCMKYCVIGIGFMCYSVVCQSGPGGQSQHLI
jgi:hypothetical protein